MIQIGQFSRISQVSIKTLRFYGEQGLLRSMDTIEVVIKRVEPIRAASVRSIIPAYSQQVSLWNELEGYLAMQRVRPVGPCFTMYYDEEYNERDVDAEVCEPIEADLAEFRSVKVRTLPGVEVASAWKLGPPVLICLRTLHNCQLLCFGCVT